jgi:vacuolar-type H+-ATPase subunit E/Vma4
MAKVKIYLDKNETQEDAEMQLRKDLDFHDNGDIHERQDYVDPAMQHLMDKLEALHQDMYEELIQEVIREIEKEYEDGYI